MGQLVGQPVLRKEGWEKVTGVRRYIDDLNLAGMIYGATIRSRVGPGIITEIKFKDTVPWDEFTIVRAKDIPGNKQVAMIVNDQPFLAETEVNHPEEPVLLIAHPDKHLLEKARAAIEIVITPKPGVFTLKESLQKKQVIWGKDNILKSFCVEKGDIDDAFKNADFIVEGVYETGAQEQLYIEPNGMMASFDPEKGVVIWGSMQCPYYVHKAIKSLFNFTDDAKVRVVQAETGGGFGGKEEYPSLIAGHTALLAYKSGRPVKMIYDRAEDLVATTKRHPSLTRHKTAVMKDGRITGLDIDFTLDGGAYATLSSVVLSRGTLHAVGPYDVPNVRINSRAVATNCPPHGAFRGFGAPQSIFAMERHLEKVAKVVGIDSVTLRRRNFLQTGGTTATGQVKRDIVDMEELLKRALEISDFERKRKLYAESNRKDGSRKRGIGLATFMHGAGFTGSGEKDLKSIVAVEATAHGRVRVLAGSTEIGQGTNTVFSQIAGDVLGLAYDQIEVAQPDTSQVPDSGPTVASRTVMVVGKLVENACLSLRTALEEAGFVPPNARGGIISEACARYVRERGPLKVFSQYAQPPEITWDNDTYKGDAYATYAWAVYVADVTVDLVTYDTHIEDFVALQEVGKVVNPVLAAGQIEGGVAQAIGYALYEKVVWREGRMANGRMTNYIMPTSADLPPIRVYFDEKPGPYGPNGAKGIGELPMDGTAPAIVNAMEHALGISIPHIPVLPEDLFEALKGAPRE